jgi:hydrogenase-4 component E
MSQSLIWALVALGLMVVFVRRRYVAIGLVTAQAALIGLGALLLAGDRPREFMVAALVLVLRAVALGALLFVSVRRTREARPLQARSTPLYRVTVVVTAVLVVSALLPSLGLQTRAAEQAAAALLLVGAATIILRRPTIFHLLGVLIAENGLALAAVSVPGGLPLLIELGVAFDLVVIMTVAIAFHEQIFGELGTGDSTLLRSLRD